MQPPKNNLTPFLVHIYEIIKLYFCLEMTSDIFLENISPCWLKIPVLPLAAVYQNARPSAPMRPLPVTLRILDLLKDDTREFPYKGLVHQAV